MNYPPSPQGCCPCEASDLEPSLTKVQSRLVSPDGRPLAGKEVVAVLRATPNWLADRTGRALGTATTRTGKEGWWALRLLPSDAVETPDYVYYEVIEHNATSYARVPSGGGEVHLRDILVDVPPDPPGRWHPIDTLGKLHNVDRDVDDAPVGHALLYNGVAWVPGAVASTLGALGNVAPGADDSPEEGQALVYSEDVWAPGTLTTTTQLAKLEDVDATSLGNASVGDTLAYLGEGMWGVQAPAPPGLDMVIYGDPEGGPMSVVAELFNRKTELGVTVYWDNSDPESDSDIVDPETNIVRHTYPTSGMYEIYAEYDDVSESVTREFTVPWE